MAPIGNAKRNYTEIRNDAVQQYRQHGKKKDIQFTESKQLYLHEKGKPYGLNWKRQREKQHNGGDQIRESINREFGFLKNAQGQSIRIGDLVFRNLGIKKVNADGLQRIDLEIAGVLRGIHPTNMTASQREAIAKNFEVAAKRGAVHTHAPSGLKNKLKYAAHPSQAMQLGVVKRDAGFMGSWPNKLEAANRFRQALEQDFRAAGRSDGAAKQLAQDVVDTLQRNGNRTDGGRNALDIDLGITHHTISAAKTVVRQLLNDGPLNRVRTPGLMEFRQQKFLQEKTKILKSQLTETSDALLERSRHSNSQLMKKAGEFAHKMQNLTSRMATMPQAEFMRQMTEQVLVGKELLAGLSQSVSGWEPKLAPLVEQQIGIANELVSAALAPKSRNNLVLRPMSTRPEQMNQSNALHTFTPQFGNAHEAVPTTLYRQAGINSADQGFVNSRNRYTVALRGVETALTAFQQSGTDGDLAVLVGAIRTADVASDLYLKSLNLASHFTQGRKSAANDSLVQAAKTAVLDQRKELQKVGLMAGVVNDTRNFTALGGSLPNAHPRDKQSQHRFGGFRLPAPPANLQQFIAMPLQAERLINAPPARVANRRLQPQANRRPQPRPNLQNAPFRNFGNSSVSSFDDNSSQSSSSTVDFPHDAPPTRMFGMNGLRNPMEYSSASETGTDVDHDSQISSESGSSTSSGSSGGSDVDRMIDVSNLRVSPDNRVNVGQFKVEGNVSETVSENSSSESELSEGDETTTKPGLGPTTTQGLNIDEVDDFSAPFMDDADDDEQLPDLPNPRQNDPVAFANDNDDNAIDWEANDADYWGDDIDDASTVGYLDQPNGADLPGDDTASDLTPVIDDDVESQTETTSSTQSSDTSTNESQTASSSSSTGSDSIGNRSRQDSQDSGGSGSVGMVEVPDTESLHDPLVDSANDANLPPDNVPVENENVDAPIHRDRVIQENLARANEPEFDPIETYNVVSEELNAAWDANAKDNKATTLIGKAMGLFEVLADVLRGNVKDHIATAAAAKELLSVVADLKKLNVMDTTNCQKLAACLSDVETTEATFQNAFNGMSIADVSDILIDAVRPIEIGMENINIELDTSTNELVFKISLNDVVGIDRLEININTTTGVADLSHVEVDNAAQGKGLMPKFFKALLNIGNKSKAINKLTMTANISVGGYAWAKAGFRPANPEQFREIAQASAKKIQLYRKLYPKAAKNGNLAKLQKKLEDKNADMAGAAQAIAGLKLEISSEHVGEFLHKNAPSPDQLKGKLTLGKACLLGTDWKASLDLTKESDVRKIKAYSALNNVKQGLKNILKKLSKK